jgi:hypothetical protein
MPPVGVKPTVPASERPQTHAITELRHWLSLYGNYVVKLFYEKTQCLRLQSSQSLFVYLEDGSSALRRNVSTCQ